MKNNFQNTTFLFVPFSFKDPKQFHPLIGALNTSEDWIQVENSNKYLLRYVADKIEGTNIENRQCFRFRLSEQAYSKLNINQATDWYRILSPYEKTDVYKFQLQSIQLYCFSTSVCIMAFEISFSESDPYWVSSAQFYLKRVYEKNIINEKSQVASSFLELASSAMKLVSLGANFNFFFYAPENTERANMLTYLEVAPKENYDHELYYLKRCYSKNFIYVENPEKDHSEFFRSSKEITWGFSPEAAVCLVTPELRNDTFIKEAFYPNFKNQYLFMYIFLLHQKYVLYMFLTNLGIETYENLEILESYRQRLYEFETDFMFYSITDVPQYQNLYEKLYKVFGLKEMCVDVREPLLSLTELRREAVEKHQHERDKKVNNSLMLLSFLTLFSTLMDGFSFIEQISTFFHAKLSVTEITQLAVSVIILIVSIFAIANIFFSNKKD